jgi:hypothetical protein
VETKAAAEAKAEAAKEEQVAAKQGNPGNGKPGPVRVTYVPDFVKDEIRAEVSKELRDEVVKEVKSQAKTEKWGVPAALPDWVNRFKLSGDIRLRGEGDFYADDNPDNESPEHFTPFYSNWLAINRGADPETEREAYFNTSEDRNRYRMRLRLGLTAEITKNLIAGVRIATSNDRSPVSINQTLGQTGRQYELALDRAYLEYDFEDAKGRDWFTLWGGRFNNPWFSTDNLYDPDLGFEGFAGTFRIPIGDKPAVTDNYYRLGPQFRQINFGHTVADSVYLTLGAFPLQEVELSSKDKWMVGAQLGFDMLFGSESRLKFGTAIYEFNNVAARPNQLIPGSNDNRENDHTAPEFMQKGNSIMQISNDDGELFPRLVGIASDFRVLDFTAAYDYSGFDPIHVMLTGDFSENLGYDEQEILERAAPVGGRAGLLAYDNTNPKTTAFQVRLDVGYPEITKFGNWSAFLAYKYLERDAVLDAFTDSNFRLGGTNAKGWVFGANYGLAKNTWLNVRWMSADEIDGPPFGVDVLLVDLNARY